MTKDIILHVLKEATPYMDRIAIRREALTKGDEQMYNYSFSLAFDREKHTDHNRLCNAVKAANMQLISKGEAPLCGESRTEMDKFCCIAAGREELVNYVD